MAEREGFEPSKDLTPYSLSRGALSTTQPPLLIEWEGNSTITTQISP
tara:strand:+ start:14634 stop:14774 length:141 start_codon:yes stop_codon:yes gene_type:complete